MPGKLKLPKCRMCGMFDWFPEPPPHRWTIIPDPKFTSWLWNNYHLNLREVVVCDAGGQSILHEVTVPCREKFLYLIRPFHALYEREIECLRLSKQAIRTVKESSKSLNRAALSKQIKALKQLESLPLSCLD